MVSTTYSGYGVNQARNSREAARHRRSFFERVMDSIAESRQRAAMTEIAKHAHLLSPQWFEQIDDSASSCATRGQAGDENRESAARSPASNG